MLIRYPRSDIVLLLMRRTKFSDKAVPSPPRRNPERGETISEAALQRRGNKMFCMLSADRTQCLDGLQQEGLALGTQKRMGCDPQEGQDWRRQRAGRTPSGRDVDKVTP